MFAINDRAAFYNNQGTLLGNCTPLIDCTVELNCMDDEWMWDVAYDVTDNDSVYIQMNVTVNGSTTTIVSSLTPIVVILETLLNVC